MKFFKDEELSEISSKFIDTELTVKTFDIYQFFKSYRHLNIKQFLRLILPKEYTKESHIWEASNINNSNFGLKTYLNLIEMIFVNPPINSNTTFHDYLNNITIDKKLDKKFLNKNEKGLKNLKIQFDNLGVLVNSFYENDYEKLLNLRLIDYYNIISFELLTEDTKNFNMDYINNLIKIYLDLSSNIDSLNILYKENLLWERPVDFNKKNKKHSFIELFTNMFLTKSFIEKIEADPFYEILLENCLTKMTFQTDTYSVYLNIFMERPLFINRFIIANFSLEELSTLIFNFNKFSFYKDRDFSNIDLCKALLYFKNNKNYIIPLKLASQLYENNL